MTLEIIGNFFRWLSSLQGWVLIPIFLFIFGLIAGVGLKESIKSSVLAGIGLLGLMTIISFVFAPYIMPVVGEFGQVIGKEFTVADAGVFSLLTVTWGAPLAIFYIPVGFAVNLLMLWAGLTKTLDADLLNYWCWGTAGIVIWIMTDSYLLGMVAFVINEIIILKIADISTDSVQPHFNLPNISISHGGAGLFAPVGILLEWVYERIPGFKDWKLDPESIRKRIGIFGEPWFIGMILGLIFGIASRWPVDKILTLAVALAGVMVLLPRMVGVMMEGLIPLAEGIRNWGSKIFKKEINVGIDAAVLVGFPDVLTVGIILIPIVLGLAIILPGNKVLPLADLAIATPFLISMCMAYHRGNVVRGIITGIVVFTIALYVSGALAPAYTAAGIKYGMDIVGKWTSVGQGGNWIAWIMAKITELFGFTI